MDEMLEIDRMLKEASDEIIYQTSGDDGENDCPNMAARSARYRPFPLSGPLDPDNAKDYIRLFRGRHDFRGLRGWIRNHAADLFCWCVSSFCESNDIESPDLSRLDKALYNGMRDMALRHAQDIVDYDMDGKSCEKFRAYHGKMVRERGMLVLDVDRSGDKIAITMSIGADMERLACGEAKNSAAMARLLCGAFPAIADALPAERESERKTGAPRA